MNPPVKGLVTIPQFDGIDYSRQLLTIIRDTSVNVEQTSIANFVPLQNSHENMDKKCKHTDKHTYMWWDWTVFGLLTARMRDFIVR